MEGDPAVMYRSHGAMIEVVPPLQGGHNPWGLEGANPPGERGSDWPRNMGGAWRGWYPCNVSPPRCHDRSGPPRRGVSYHGVWMGPIPQEKEGPIGPGIWVVRGEAGSPVMYHPHVAMIKVVPPEEG